MAKEDLSSTLTDEQLTAVADRLVTHGDAVHNAAARNMKTDFYLASQVIRMLVERTRLLKDMTRDAARLCEEPATVERLKKILEEN